MSGRLFDGSKVRSPTLKGLASFLSPSPSVAVPQNVAARLTDVRNRRAELEKSVTLSQLLSVQNVQRDLADSSLSRRNSSSGNSIQDPRTRLSFRKAARALSRPLFQVRRANTSTSDIPTTFVTPEVNKKIREQLLQQNDWTNQFQGTREAEHAEAEFYAFVTRYELTKIRLRLVVISFGLLFTSIEPMLSKRTGSDLAVSLLLGTALPVGFVAGAAALCFIPRTRRARLESTPRYAWAGMRVRPPRHSPAWDTHTPHAARHTPHATHATALTCPQTAPPTFVCYCAQACRAGGGPMWSLHASERTIASCGMRRGWTCGGGVRSRTTTTRAYTWSGC